MSDFTFPKVLIHIGRPDLSKPHEDLSVIANFARENPDVAVVMIVDTDEDQKAMEERVVKELKWPPGHPGGLIISWKDDSEMVDMLCGKMYGTVSWRVVGNGWYECPEGHQTGATMKTPLEKCPSCQKPMTFIRVNEPRVEQFKALLTKAASLMKFDTRSGVILKTMVSPDANVLKNMVNILGCKHEPALTLKEFAGKGKGKTAICVSAGPSLDDEMENLKRLQHTSLILCVGRVYKRLRAEGIRVDYTFSCEMFDWDAAIFEGLTDTGDTVMCYPNVCAPATINAWPGKKVCMLDAQMADYLGETLFMMGGNSVSHHQLNFACEILDCDTIILVGQDLAYTKPGVTHAKGSDDHKWPGEVTAQDKSMHGELEWGECYGRGDRFHPEQHRQAGLVAPGKILPVGGMEVRTSKPYKNFAVLFEILVSRHKKKVLNACGEGLKIAGVPYVNLSEWGK
jgi:hypothetical protein